MMSNYFLDATVSNFINFSKRANRGISLGFVSFSNFLNLLYGEFRFKMRGSWISPNAVFASFLKHIKDIFLLCSKKKMAGVNAGSYIASMQNKKSFWDWSHKKGPSCTSTAKELALNGKMGIAFLIGRVGPKPASVGNFVNPRQEKRFVELDGLHLYEHRLLSGVYDQLFY